MREKHPMAGKPVELTSGPHKGKYFITVDWLQNQYQGKAMEAIAKSHPELTGQVTSRFDLDDKIVFGKLYPLLNFICVHDSEMQSETPDNVIPIGVKHDTERPSDGDLQAASSEGPDTDGCTISSAADDGSSADGDKPEAEADRPAGRKGNSTKKVSKRKTP